MNKTSVAAVILTLILSLCAEAQRPVRPTGIFSNMQMGEGGNVVGTEIFVTYSGGNHWALVQHSKFGLNLVVLVKANVEGSRIRFEMPFDSTTVLHSEGGRAQELKVNNLWHFQGEFKEDRLIGRFNGEDWETLDLARGKSYWQ